jgi:hypothetical protein
MAAVILGYLADPPFKAFLTYFLNCAGGSGWSIEWSPEKSDLPGSGFMRFGQVKRAGRSEGIGVISLTSRANNALTAAQQADKRRNTILFATALTEQKDLLPHGNDNDNIDFGHVVIKDGVVPMLSEFSSAVLLWGKGWGGERGKESLPSLADEIIKTFVFPETAQSAEGKDANVKARVPPPEMLDAYYEGVG